MIVAGNSDVTGYDDALVLKLSASDGSLQWYKLYGDTGVQIINSVNIYNDQIILVGYSVLGGVGNFADVLVMKLTPTGTTSWAKKYGDSSFDFGIDFQIDSDTSKFWVGASTQSSRLRNGGTDFLLLRLSFSNGSRDICKHLGTTSNDELTHLTADTNNQNLFIGGVTDSISLSKGLNDFLIVKYGLSQGLVQWVGTIGSNEDDNLESISYTDSDSTTKGLYIIGYTSNLANSIGGVDTIVVKLDTSSLAVIWQVLLGSSLDDFMYSSLIDSTGYLVLAGKSNNGIIFGLDYLGRSQ